MEERRIIYKKIIAGLVFGFIVTDVYADGLGGLSLGPMIHLLYYVLSGLVPALCLLFIFLLRRGKKLSKYTVLALLFIPCLFGFYGVAYLVLPPHEKYTTLMGVVGIAFLIVSFIAFKSNVQKIT